MKLISSQTINNTVVDGYYDTEKAWFTREQIGLALEYTDPIRSVSHIHNRHKERLDPLSVVVKLTTTDGIDGANSRKPMKLWTNFTTWQRK